MGGIFNIVIGIIMIVGGLSGRLALLGTNSPKILAAVGVVVLALGIYQVAKKRNG